MQTTTRHKVRVQINADTGSLSCREQELLRELRQVAGLINQIYLWQRKGEPFPFWPIGLTATELDSYLKLHPTAEGSIQSPFTAVIRHDTQLLPVNYSFMYERQLKLASERLEVCAQLSDNPSFARFLRSRAQALLTNDYRQSEIDWVSIAGGPFDLVIGAEEAYEDKDFGCKQSFQMILGRVLEAENARLALFQQWAPQFDRQLGRHLGYVSSSGICPLVVMDEILAGGYARYGFVFMALSLPNSASLKREIGSRKLLIANVIQAKFEHITRKIARRVLDSNLASLISPEIFLTLIMGHEMAHGFGLDCLGNLSELGPTFDEAKADVFGLLFLEFLRDQEILAPGVAELAAMAGVVDSLRRIRLSPDEDHGRAGLMQLRWLIEHGALSLGNGKLSFKTELLFPAFKALASELARLTLMADCDEARGFVNHWSTEVAGMASLLESIQHISYDIDPVFAE